MPQHEYKRPRIKIRLNTLNAQTTITNSHFQKARKAFDIVMSTFREFTLTGSLHASDLSPVHGGRNPSKPSRVDFLIEVAIAARQHLTGERLKEFLAAFSNEDRDYTRMLNYPIDRLNGLITAIGEEFRRRSIFPIPEYFRSQRQRLAS